MITVLSGTNTFLLKQAAQEIVQAFLAEQGDMALERFDGESLEPSRVREVLTALPFLSTQRMVVIKNASQNKAVAEQLQALLSEVPDSTNLVLIEDKPDKRSGYYKALQKQANFHEFNELQEPQLAGWLVEETKKADGTLSSIDAKFLISRIGPNQLMLWQELQKLLTYDKTITRETIELLTEPLPQSSVFELLDAAMAGNTKRTLELYHEQRQQKVEPLAILAMIGWQLHVLAVIKTAGQLDPIAIASKARLSPYVVRKSMAVARRINYEQLKEWVSAAHILDVRLKSESIDPDEALQYLLLSFAETK